MCEIRGRHNAVHDGGEACLPAGVTFWGLGVSSGSLRPLLPALVILSLAP